MPFNIHNRSLLSLMHHSERELRHLLDLSRDLKRAKYTGTERQHLKGKNIALIFEKTSTRTRCAFEVAAYDQGANVTYIDPNSSQIGHKESMKDTARVLGRMYDAIEYRGFKQEIVEELARYAGVPVYNGLTDEYHPTQMIADVMTMREHSDKALHQISYAYLGDARNNMGNSLLLIGAKLGMDVRIAAPRALWPSEAHIKACQDFAAQSGAHIATTFLMEALPAAGRRVLATVAWLVVAALFATLTVATFRMLGPQKIRRRSLWIDRIKIGEAEGIGVK